MNVRAAVELSGVWSCSRQAEWARQVAAPRLDLYPRPRQDRQSPTPLPHKLNFFNACTMPNCVSPGRLYRSIVSPSALLCDGSLDHGPLDLCFCCLDELTFGDAVFAEVKWLLFDRIVLSNVSVLCRAQERLDALRVVAEGKEEVLIVVWLWFRHSYKANLIN